MSSKYLSVGIFLFACACTDRTRQAEVVEDDRAPGIVRFSTIGPKDVVYLDGEEVPSVGLARTRNELMLAPGAYALRIKTAEGATCDSRLVVRPGAVAVPGRCGAKTGTAVL